MMTLDRPEFEDVELQPAEIAAMRWQAIEAANTMPGLSPMARRVLIAMICTMDNKSRACFPSELWLANYLGVNVVSVKKAKAELREARLVTWSNPNGPRHQSHYIFNWERLQAQRDSARSIASQEVEKRRSKTPRNGSQVTTFGHSNGSHMTTMDAPQGSQTAINPVDNSGSKVAVSPSQGSQIAPQGSHLATAKVATPLPEQPLITDLPYQPCVSRHARPASEAVPGVAKGMPSSSPTASCLMPQGQGEKEQVRKAKTPKCFYPKLWQAFEGEQGLLDAIASLTAEDQAKAAKVLAMNGQNAARSLISPNAEAGHA